jgi:hypothetical protein
MAKKKKSLEERLKEAAKKEKKPDEPTLTVPSKVAAERAELGKVKLRRPSRLAQETPVRTETPFGPLNWWLLILGIAVAAVGFVFLYLGDTVFSTTLLVLGYCVVIPVALLISPNILKKKPKKEEEASPKAESGSQPEPGASEEANG